MTKRQFVLVVVDRDTGEFTVEGPMGDDRLWNSAVVTLATGAITGAATTLPPPPCQFAEIVRIRHGFLQIDLKSETPEKCRSVPTDVCGSTSPINIGVALTPSARSANLIAGDGTRNGLSAPTRNRQCRTLVKAAILPEIEEQLWLWAADFADRRLARSLLTPPAWLPAGTDRDPGDRR
jgi:hypothetical protein